VDEAKAAAKAATDSAQVYAGTRQEEIDVAARNLANLAVQRACGYLRGSLAFSCGSPPSPMSKSGSITV
jgi:hypothetical protein